MLTYLQQRCLLNVLGVGRGDISVTLIYFTRYVLLFLALTFRSDAVCCACERVKIKQAYENDQAAGFASVTLSKALVQENVPIKSSLDC